jgi:hypothetical protein
VALPELIVAPVQRWCAVRVPEHVCHHVRVECEVAPTPYDRRAARVLARGLRARGPLAGLLV